MQFADFSLLRLLLDPLALQLTQVLLEAGALLALLFELFNLGPQTQNLLHIRFFLLHEVTHLVGEISLKFGLFLTFSRLILWFPCDDQATLLLFLVLRSLEYLGGCNVFEALLRHGENVLKLVSAYIYEVSAYLALCDLVQFAPLDARFEQQEPRRGKLDVHS